MHVRAGDHDLADLQLAEFDGAENEFFFADRQQSPFAGLLNLNLQLFGGMGDAVPGWPHNSERANNRTGNPVEQIDGPTKRVEKPCKGARDHQGDPLGAGQADGFGYEFAEHHMNSAKDCEGKRERSRVSKEEHPHAAIRRQEALEEIRERGLAQRANSQASQCNAHLDAGNYAVKIGEELLDDSRLRAALGHQLAHAREAHRHERKLDGGEETVQGHQHKNSDDPDQKHSAERTSSRHCNSRFGWKEEGVGLGCRIERIEILPDKSGLPTTQRGRVARGGGVL